MGIGTASFGQKKKKSTMIVLCRNTNTTFYILFLVFGV